jgi:hypothetical protein
MSYSIPLHGPIVIFCAKEYATLEYIQTCSHKYLQTKRQICVNRSFQRSSKKSYPKFKHDPAIILIQENIHLEVYFESQTS